MLAPICLFTYNRLSETKQTIAALHQNYLATESELFIFSDGAKNEEGVLKVNEVRTFLKGISGFKTITIFESDNNKGLANSIIDGVSQIIEKYGKVIVLEDDLITTPNFLDFMNQALGFYENTDQIQSINGFSVALNNDLKDVYFQTRPFSWGWATWEDRWNKKIFNKEEIKKIISCDNKVLSKFKKECGNDVTKMLLDSINNINDSWYIRWAFNHFMNEKVSVYPTYSLVENIGFSEDGTHCKGINSYKSKNCLSDNAKFDFIAYSGIDDKLKAAFLNYFSKFHKIKIRFHLLASSSGRNKLWFEFKSKII